MAQNTRKLVGVILMLAMLVAAIAALTVTAAAAGTTVIVSIKDYAGTNSWANGVKYTSLTMDTNVTVTVSGTDANTGKYYTSGNEWRIYQTGTPSIEVKGKDGVVIESVTITYNISNTGVLTYDGSNIQSGTSVTVNANSATFGVGNTGTKTNGQVKITKIEVVYSSNTVACNHANTTAIGEAVEPTCVKNGITAGEKCANENCGAIITAQETIPATGKHNYVDGVCTMCDAKEPVAGQDVTVSKTAADMMGILGLSTSNGTSVDGKNIALDNNISVIFAKGNSSTAPAYYSPAIRLYQNGATLTVKGVGMKTIIITVNGSAGAGPISVDGGTASALTEMKYTITVNAGATEVVITTTGTDKNSRVYVSNLEVVYAVADDSDCEHTGGNATCLEQATCDSCGEKYGNLGDHSYTDHVCTICGEDDPDHYFVMTIPEAVAAADGKKVQVSGTVCAINTAWSDSYGNISVTIEDENGNELYLYRLATNVALGDIITVQGAMGTFNSARQVAQGATATIDGHDDSYDYTEMTIEEALAAADNTNVIVTGTVVEINIEYSESYGNISVTIEDENGNQLYLYRLNGNVAYHENITVKGAMATYNENRQIAGGTFTSNGVEECSEYSDATCTEAAKCVVCGATKGEALGHSYTVFKEVALEDVNSIPVAVYKCANCEETENRSIVTFMGGSIRYADVNGVECGTDKIALRFGYQIDVNVIDYFGGLEAFKAIADWSWTYSATVGGVEKSASVAGYYITEDGVTNLVLTNIPLEYIITEFTVDFTLTLNDDEIHGTFENTAARTTEGVLEMTALDEREEFAAAAAYAKKVLYAYDDEKYVAYAPSINEEENA